MIWLTSDLHLGHDREFVWGPRGFKSSHEHDIEVVDRFCEKVSNEDEVYILGDLVLGDTNRGIGYLRELPGNIHIIRGNHDTDARITRYKELPNVVEIVDAARLKYNKYHFYLSHYPTLTANFEKESLKQVEINLCGHKHIKDKIEIIDNSFLYHVELEAHNNYPVNIETIISDLLTYTDINV